MLKKQLSQCKRFHQKCTSKILKHHNKPLKSIMEGSHLKFGVSLGFGLNAKERAEAAVEAENLGYDGIFMADHIGKVGSMDPFITLSYLAGKTTTIRLGVMVTPVPRYVPAHLATLISTLDAVSNGRFIAGVGAGYEYYEFRNYAPGGVYDDVSVRSEKFLEGLRLMKKLWETPHPYRVYWKGKYYSLEEAFLWPKPVQKPHPPVWMGGSGTKALRAAAELCSGWMGPIFGGNAQYPAEVYENNVKKIQKFAKEYNRDLSNFTFASWGCTYDVNVPTDIVAKSGGLGSIHKMDTPELIESYKAAGCQYWIIACPFMRQFAKEIMPSFN